MSGALGSPSRTPRPDAARELEHRLHQEMKRGHGSEQEKRRNLRPGNPASSEPPTSGLRLGQGRGRGPGLSLSPAGGASDRNGPPLTSPAPARNLGTASLGAALRVPRYTARGPTKPAESVREPPTRRGTRQWAVGRRQGVRLRRGKDGAGSLRRRRRRRGRG